MCYLWNKKFLEKYRMNCDSFMKNDLSKQITVLEKILSYDSELERIFNKKVENYAIKKINRDFRTDISICAAIIVKNEERCISRCLFSIIEEVDEIIVVDTGSTDNTIKLIKSINSHKIKLFYRKWRNDFSDVRNYALEKVTTEWVFFIDADEILDIHNLILKDYFSTFQNFPYIENTVFCPKIVDVNGNVSVGVQRVFKKSSGIKFYGKVHEELRKYNNEDQEDLYSISLDLPIKHDGYIDSVMKEKNKRYIYTNLGKLMIEEEPENPRWVYFYLRDGKDILSLDVYKMYIKKFLLIDRNADIEISNLSKHKYTYALLTLYAIKNFVCGNLSETIILSEIMNKIQPGNSDSVYLSVYSKILLMKSQEANLLKLLVDYRSNNMDSQYGMLHSEGTHIDLLIGYLLFQLGHIERAMAYFELTKQISNQDMLIVQCKKIEQIIELLL